MSRMSSNISLNKFNQVLNVVHEESISFLWHMRLGHTPYEKLKQLNSIRDVIANSCCIKECSLCPLAKQTRTPFPLSNSRTVEPFSLQHLDLWGPYNHTTHDNKRFFFVTIVDYYTRYTWIFFFIKKLRVISFVVWKISSHMLKISCL